MQLKQHYQGIWFLPEYPENKITGLLNFDPKKGTDLELFGFLSEVHDSNYIEIIVGITSDGKEITLYKCSRYHLGFNSNGFKTSKYEAQYFLKGSLQTTNDLQFKSIAIQFKDFDKWLNIYGFANYSNRYNNEIQLEYKEPKTLSFDLGNEIYCDFQFYTISPILPTNSSITITQICQIVLYKKGNALPILALLELFQSFNAFLTLAYFAPPLIEEIALYGECNMELFFRTDVIPDNYNLKTSKSHFLFSFYEIEPNFQQLLANWFLAEKEITPTVYGLIDTFSKKEKILELSFLTIAYSIETFHRRRRKNNNLPNNEFKEKLNEVLQSVDEKLKPWLVEQLEYSNEPRLHDRLVDLIQELPTNISFLLLKPSEEWYIKHFKWSRNYYTHYSKSLEKKALSGTALFMLTERSKLLLLCILLMEIGFSPKELEKIILSKGVILFNHIVKQEEVKILKI